MYPVLLVIAAIVIILLLFGLVIINGAVIAIRERVDSLEPPQAGKVDAIYEHQQMQLSEFSVKVSSEVSSLGIRLDKLTNSIPRGTETQFHLCQAQIDYLANKVGGGMPKRGEFLQKLHREGVITIPAQPKTVAPELMGKGKLDRSKDAHLSGVWATCPGCGVGIGIEHKSGCPQSSAAAQLGMIDATAARDGIAPWIRDGHTWRPFNSEGGWKCSRCEELTVSNGMGEPARIGMCGRHLDPNRLDETGGRTQTGPAAKCCECGKPAMAFFNGKHWCVDCSVLAHARGVCPECKVQNLFQHASTCSHAGENTAMLAKTGSTSKAAGELACNWFSPGSPNGCKRHGPKCGPGHSPWPKPEDGPFDPPWRPE